MTIFGKSKRKQTLLEASPNSKPIYHNSSNNNNNNKSNKSKNTITDKVRHKDKYLHTQSSLNLTQPPPPYSSSAPLQPNRWPTYQGPYHTPYQYPPPTNQVSQVHLVGRPLPPPHHGMYKQDVKGKSCTNLPATLTRPAQCLSDGIDAWHNRNTESRNPRAGLCDLISSKLDTVLTLIDGERFSGDERELVIYQNPQPPIRGGGALGTRDLSRNANNVISTALTSTNYFAKANLYANSRLPANLPPLKLYMPTYPLLCLAAQFSQRVYTRPAGAERETHVDADWRLGTKAMVIKSVPIDDMNTVVFAIRGSQTFMDWAVNLNSAPTSPTGFLDDPGNLCHSGFLSVARKMMKPVAARLRSMLEEDPSRASCSLLITGHSAGGAVASLLYAHMLAKEVKSELNILTGCFKRVHCITFGAPPISLLPISTPPPGTSRKSLFLSFINEGDPVPRADKAYVRSLLDLYASPTPGSTCLTTLLPSCPIAAKFSSSPPQQHPSPQSPLPPPPPPAPPTKKQPLTLLPTFKPRPKPPPPTTTGPTVPQAITWKVPPSTLSNAGRLVLLRARPPGSKPAPSAGRAKAGTTDAQRDEDNVTMCVTTDEQLRGVIFGDPVMHMMSVYARRIEVLATRAVTVRVWG